MIVFCKILTLVCSLRACHVWLTRNHIFIRKCNIQTTKSINTTKLYSFWTVRSFLSSTFSYKVCFETKRASQMCFNLENFSFIYKFVKRCYSLSIKATPWKYISCETRIAFPKKNNFMTSWEISIEYDFRFSLTKNIYKWPAY